MLVFKSSPVNLPVLSYQLPQVITLCLVCDTADTERPLLVTVTILL